MVVNRFLVEICTKEPVAKRKLRKLIKDNFDTVFVGILDVVK